MEDTGEMGNHIKRWCETFREAVPVLAVEAFGPFVERGLAADDICVHVCVSDGTH